MSNFYTDRYAEVTYRFCMGHSYTVSEVATEFGISRPGAYKMLDRISRVVPLVSEEVPRTERGMQPGGPVTVWRLIEPLDE